MSTNPSEDPDALTLRTQELARTLKAEPQAVGQALGRLVDGERQLIPHQSDRSTEELARFHVDEAARLLLTACRSLKFKDAVELIESVEPPILQIRVQVARHLASCDRPVPLYSREELADEIEQFRGYLETHRSHLIQTGLPAAPFGRCPWLKRRLVRLYPVHKMVSPDVEYDPVGDPAFSVWLQTRMAPTRSIQVPSALPEVDVVGDETLRSYQSLDRVTDDEGRIHVGERGLDDEVDCL